MLEHPVLVENTFAKLDVECLKSEFVLKGDCHVDGGEKMNNRKTCDYKYDYNMWLRAARIANQNLLKVFIS